MRRTTRTGRGGRTYEPRPTRSRATQAKGKERVVEVGEASNPPEIPTPPVPTPSIVTDQDSLRTMIQQIVTDALDRRGSESTGKPAEVEPPPAVPRERVEIPPRDTVAPSPDPAVRGQMDRGDRVGQASPVRHDRFQGILTHHSAREFRGTVDPLVADEWIRLLERTTGLMGFSDRERVQYASILFRGDARIWWETIEQSRDTSTMTWAEFRVLFEAQYRTAEVVARKVQEFVTLRQGGLSVREYSTRFNSLASFAPTMIATEELRRDRFIQGLRPEIYVHLVSSSQLPRDYAEALDRASRVEVGVNAGAPQHPPQVVSSTPQTGSHRGGYRGPHASQRDNRGKRRTAAGEGQAAETSSWPSPVSHV